MDAEQAHEANAPSEARVRDETPSKNFPIVGVGASAGGLEALEHFFDNMPPHTGMAFVVVQHLSPDFKSMMDELLARHTTMTIRRVEEGMRVEPDHIYLIPPKSIMTLVGGCLRLTEYHLESGSNLPIDLFFRSLAADAGARAVGVVLSGTGSDGSRGLQAIHDRGGFILVQDNSAAFDGMPRAAIATGICDVVCRAEEMAGNILEYIDEPDSFDRHRSGPESSGELGDIDTVFRLFRTRYGLDFRFYKPTTIQRRLERRIQLSRSGGLSDYLELLQSSEAELDLLYRDLLVEVTEFFRDPPIFERLQVEVVSDMVGQAAPNESIRVWVAGCATGEEAYSIAALFLETMKLAQKELDVKVFATDVHHDSLETASTGVFQSSSITKVPAHLRSEYFVQHGDLVRVCPELRQLVIFATHDITRDPPFTKIDILSCRNVLIYLEPEVQQRVLSMFHYGLKVGGTLLLGPSETVGELAREFEVIDRHWRLYRKLRDTCLPTAMSVPLMPSSARFVSARPPFVARGGVDERETRYSKVFEDLLDRFVPPSLLVNAAHELLHSFGDAAQYLVQPKGRPTLDVLKMVTGDLRMSLSAGLHRACREKRRVVFEGVKVENQILSVSVEPYQVYDSEAYLISLEKIETAKPPEVPKEEFRLDDESASRIVDLERELDYTRETLQTTVEELESSNEELQGTNEELVASNEELQSTNEELHSVNEELYTVNAEHQRKIQELTELSTDVDNLLRSTEIATIFLDRDLRIRKFTPTITTAFNVLDQDIGRPIHHIAFNLDNPAIIEDVESVLESGEPREMEVHNGEGRTFLQRVLPYRTQGEEIEGIMGVVVSFIDITERTGAEAALRESKELFQELVENIEDVFWIIGNDGGKMIYVSPAFESVWGRPVEELYANPRLWLDVIHPEDRLRVETAFLGESFVSGTHFLEEYRIQRDDGTVRWIEDRRTSVVDEHGEVCRIVGVAKDISELRQEQFENRRFLDLYENLPMLTASISARGGTILQCSNWLLERLGHSREKIVGKHVTSLYHPDCQGFALRTFREFLDVGEVRRVPLELQTSDGTRIEVLLTATAVRDDRGEIVASRSVWLDRREEEV